MNGKETGPRFFKITQESSKGNKSWHYQKILLALRLLPLLRLTLNNWSYKTLLYAGNPLELNVPTAKSLGENRLDWAISREVVAHPSTTTRRER